MTDISKFKATLAKITGFLDELYGNDMDYQMGKDKLDLALKANPRDSIALFIEAIVPYGSRILEGDEKFFLNYTIPSNLDMKSLDIISKIKGCWLKLQADRKQMLLNNLKLVIILGTIISRNEEMRKIINKYRDEDNPLTFD